MHEKRLRGIAAGHLVSKYQALLDEERRLQPNPPTHLNGRGIVICAGGPRYFACAWVLIQQLREKLQCSLPIQVWYAGPRELDDRMIALLEAIAGVECKDATRITGHERIESCGGWALKPFALINSPFREVLLLDADNLPLMDPEFLFDDPHFAETGAIFWPDLQPVSSQSLIWDVTRVPYRKESSFESGQMVIDKVRCWKPLLLTMHLNEHARFYYQLIHGDKDTFHFAWHMAGYRYSMPGESPRYLMSDDRTFRETGPLLLQTGFDGAVIFQHRNWPKWTAFGNNPRFPGSLYEEECLEFLSRLRALWDGRIHTLPPVPTEYFKSPGGTRWFRYIRLSISDCLMELLPDGRIGFGATPCERSWVIRPEVGTSVLLITGDFGTTCRLSLERDGVWRGRWLFNELGFTELIPYNGGITP